MTLPEKYMKLSLLSLWNYDQPHQNVALDKKYGPHIMPELKGCPKVSTPTAGTGPKVTRLIPIAESPTSIVNLVINQSFLSVLPVL
jgi:hypothetical protein